MKFSFEEFRKVYETLEDEISREIFFVRLRYSITYNHGTIMELPNKYKNLDADTKNLTEYLMVRDKKMVIFGAGNNGRALAQYIKGVDFFAFIDNYRKDKVDEETKLPIYSMEEYISKFDLMNTCFVISVVDCDASAQIRKQLLEVGVSEVNIIAVAKDWRNNESQYFDVFAPMNNEVFVDCGCYDGATAYRFAGWCGAKSYSKIICFEPDPDLYNKCSNVLRKLSDCSVYQYGLSDKYEEVSFLADGSECARIVDKGSFPEEKVQTIHTVDLDTFLKDERVTFIKMDIEGAEYDALVGASNIIKEQKPRLAICLYHNCEHIVSIPLLLLSLRSDYKFKIRHYSMLPNETVLYAY